MFNLNSVRLTWQTTFSVTWSKNPHGAFTLHHLQPHFKRFISKAYQARPSCIGLAWIRDWLLASRAHWREPPRGCL